MATQDSRRVGVIVRLHAFNRAQSSLMRIMTSLAQQQQQQQHSSA